MGWALRRPHSRGAVSMSSTGRVNVEPLENPAPRDLDYVAANLRDEFSQMAGRRVLMTGGGGFLGYYMVQSVLHWNDGAAPADRIAMTVFDNYVGACLRGWKRCGGRKDLTLLRHDMRLPLPDPMPEFRVHQSKPPAILPSPIYYRAHRRLNTMDANITALRRLLEYARRATRRQADIFRFHLLLEQRDLRRSGAGHDSHAGRLSRQACHAPARGPANDESKRYGETLVRVFAKH